MPSKQAQLEAWLRERNSGPVELAGFEELLRLLSPIEESALRHRLRSTGVALHPLVAGVNQDALPVLHESLLALAESYEKGSPETRRLTRRIIITAKDHARLVANNARVEAAKRAEKSEMVIWMLTWLENPLIFPLWISLRQKSKTSESPGEKSY